MCGNTNCISASLQQKYLDSSLKIKEWQNLSNSDLSTVSSCALGNRLDLVSWSVSCLSTMFILVSSTGFHVDRLSCRQAFMSGFHVDRLLCRAFMSTGFHVDRLSCRAFMATGFHVDRLSCRQAFMSTGFLAERLSCRQAFMSTGFHVDEK